MAIHSGNETKKRRKNNLIKGNGAFCYYCRCQLAINSKKKDQPNYATLDQRIPRSKDRGWELPNNKILCCKKCNTAKKDMMPEDFISLLAQQLTP